MAITKAEAIKQLGTGNLSNQESLVKKIQGREAIKPVKRTIPGGKHMTESLDKTTLPNAVYTWLRHCRHFTEGTVSLCTDYTAHKTKRTRVVDFDPNSRNAEWELRGKRWLAERVAEVLYMDNVLAVVIEREGLYGIFDTEKKFNSKSEDWEPYVELIPFKPPTF